jgi:hypothetical protein
MRVLQHCPFVVLLTLSLVVTHCSDSGGGPTEPIDDVTADTAVPDVPTDITPPEDVPTDTQVDAAEDTVTTDVTDDTGGPNDTAPEDVAPADVPEEDTAPELPPPPPDMDNDGIPDNEDNCPETPNADQANTDGDPEGDACDEDMDNDGIPNDDDLGPNDPDLPGTVLNNYVYAQTSSKLFTMHMKTYTVTEIGNFKKDNGGALSSITDIAIDRYGVLYAITFNTLYICHPQTAKCTTITNLPTSFNGLTLVPKGLLDPNKDVIVGIDTGGGWHKVELTLPTATLTKLGSYGPGYSSSGDAFSIENVGTFAAVNKGSQANDYLVEVNPLTGAVLSEVGPITGYSSVFGLAASASSAFAFNSSGHILEIDLTDGSTTVIKTTSHSWWGAGVTTRF